MTLLLKNTIKKMSIYYKANSNEYANKNITTRIKEMRYFFRGHK